MFLKLFRKSRPASERTIGATADAVAAYRATGDLTILGELYEQHMELIYAVCYNYLRDEDEAKDAVMNLFEQLITDLRRHEVQQFGPWLHSVARNYCLMQLRKQQTHPKTELVLNTGDSEEEPALRFLSEEMATVGPGGRPDPDGSLPENPACRTANLPDVVLPGTKNLYGSSQPDRL